MKQEPPGPGAGPDGAEATGPLYPRRRWEASERAGAARERRRNGQARALRRPMYYGDPGSGGPLPPGFPSAAINLSVKCVAAAQAAAQAAALKAAQAQQAQQAEPTSPGGSVMDLSTSSVTSTSPQLSEAGRCLHEECSQPERSGSDARVALWMCQGGAGAAYGSAGLSPQYRSPQAAASPHLSASPQVPSPQGQTLDLSVTRVPPRSVPRPPREAVPAARPRRRVAGAARLGE
ncbi:Uncharacterized protein GBIM_04275, partial [Gryllus bimaculatus]